MPTATLPTLISICAWCFGARERTEALIAQGYEVSHGCCPTHLAALLAECDERVKAEGQVGWYLAGACVLVLIGLSRVIAIGRKAPKTWQERKEDLMRDVPQGYRITQPANRWRLRLARKNERRRSA